MTVLPKELKRIAAKALAVSITERYSNISEFINDVSLYLQSGSSEKERTGSDQIRETNEKLQKLSLNLSPIVLPVWPQIDLGAAKGRGKEQLGLYYDLFRFSDNTFLVLQAYTTPQSIESVVSIACIRGMVRMLLSDYTLSMKTTFQPISFVDKLNKLICLDNAGSKFVINLVLLNPLQDMLTYISCGLQDLMHIPQGQTDPRRLSSQNELLGASPTAEFSETSDNWNAEDTLIFHTLTLPQDARQEDKDAFNLVLKEAITENLLLSAQSQAEAVLKKMLASPSLPKSPPPKPFSRFNASSDLDVSLFTQHSLF